LQLLITTVCLPLDDISFVPMPCLATVNTWVQSRNIKNQGRKRRLLISQIAAQYRQGGQHAVYGRFVAGRLEGNSKAKKMIVVGLLNASFYWKAVNILQNQAALNAPCHK
jgi:hypothetical protein